MSISSTACEMQDRSSGWRVTSSSKHKPNATISVEKSEAGVSPSWPLTMVCENADKPTSPIFISPLLPLTYILSQRRSPCIIGML